MYHLVETRVTEIYKTRCPHCRPTQANTKEATVTITRDDKGKILDLSIDCDWARTNEQDRT